MLLVPQCTAPMFVWPVTSWPLPDIIVRINSAPSAFDWSHYVQCDALYIDPSDVSFTSPLTAPKCVLKSIIIERLADNNAVVSTNGRVQLSASTKKSWTKGRLWRGWTKREKPLALQFAISSYNTDVRIARTKRNVGCDTCELTTFSVDNGNSFLFGVNIYRMLDRTPSVKMTREKQCISGCLYGCHGIYGKRVVSFLLRLFCVRSLLMVGHDHKPDNCRLFFVCFIES